MFKQKILTLRYAEGFFSLLRLWAREKDPTELLEEAEQELIALVQLLQSNPSISNFFNHPLVEMTRKLEVLEKATRKSISETTFKLLRLLLLKHRFFLLPHLTRAFHRLLVEFEGFLEVDVRSAVPVSREQKLRMNKKLALMSGVKRIRITERIESGVIGGVSLKLDDNLLDGTVKSALNRLAKNFESLVLGEEKGGETHAH